MTLLSVHSEEYRRQNEKTLPNNCNSLLHYLCTIGDLDDMMKIRNYKISKKTVKESIAAMRLLIKMYQDKSEWGRLCPLCEINDSMSACSKKPTCG